MSLLAPEAAAPRFVRAPEAVLAPVPPFATVTGVVKLNTVPVSVKPLPAEYVPGPAY